MTERSRRDFSLATFAMLVSNGLMARSTDAPSGSWPSWRGPHRDGLVANSAWPASLQAPHLTKTWSCTLDDGYSGPIVFGNHAYATETIAKRDEALVALERSTGQQIWKKQWPGAMSVPFFAKSNGDWIRSTPATDGKYIVVGGMKGAHVLTHRKKTVDQAAWKDAQPNIYKP